jgi:hypothetical protein
MTFLSESPGRLSVFEGLLLKSLEPGTATGHVRPMTTGIETSERVPP